MGGKGGMGGMGAMGGMGGMSGMLQQAQKLQQEMQKTTQELLEKEYSASSGGGMVTAVVTGAHQLRSLTIDPEAVDPEDVEMLQDMVMAAVNEAMRAADSDRDTAMQQLTGGAKLPF